MKQVELAKLAALLSDARGQETASVPVELLDRALTELQRLGDMEQRAMNCAGDPPPGEPSPYQAAVTANYIVRGS